MITGSPSRGGKLRGARELGCEGIAAGGSGHAGKGKVKLWTKKVYRGEIDLRRVIVPLLRGQHLKIRRVCKIVTLDTVSEVRRVGQSSHVIRKKDALTIPSQKKSRLLNETGIRSVYLLDSYDRL